MGAATARMFAREGAKVVVADVLEHEGRQVAGAIGASARFEPLDSAPYERARLHLAIAYYPDCDTRDPVQHSGWGPAGAPLTLVPRGRSMSFDAFLVLVSAEMKLAILFGRSLGDQLASYRSVFGVTGLASVRLFSP